MSLTIKRALISLGCCGATNRCPCIVAQVDISSQHGFRLILSAIHLISKPCQFCACANLINILYDSRLSLCCSVPCSSIGSSQCYVEGLLTLSIIGNGIGMAIAAIACFRSCQRIVTIGTCISSIVIESNSHAIACQSIVHVLLVAQQTNDELLGFLDGNTNLWNSTKIGLVCNSREIG